MYFYEEFDLLDHFNSVCGIIADYIQSPTFYQDLDARATEVTIPCDMQFADIDDWWGVMPDDKDLMTLYIDDLTKLKNDNIDAYEDHFRVGFEMLEKFPSLNAHLHAKFDASTDSTADKIRYLPHVIRYMYPFFDSMDGYKKLKDTLRLFDEMKLDVALMPKNEADAIHDIDSYDLVLIIQSTNGETIESKFKPIKPALN